MFLVTFCLSEAEASAPGMPDVTGVTSTGCVVMWTRPETDGGADIDGYVLERRERKSARWIKCGKKVIRDLRYVMCEVCHVLLLQAIYIVYQIQNVWNDTKQ